MDQEIRQQVEAELRQIAVAIEAEPEPTETLDELVARKRREQGIVVQELIAP